MPTPHGSFNTWRLSALKTALSQANTNVGVVLGLNVFDELRRLAPR
jgi:hypothetical protein